MPQPAYGVPQALGCTLSPTIWGARSRQGSRDGRAAQPRDKVAFFRNNPAGQKASLDQSDGGVARVFLQGGVAISAGPLNNAARLLQEPQRRRAGASAS